MKFYKYTSILFFCFVILCNGCSGDDVKNSIVDKGIDAKIQNHEINIDSLNNKIRELQNINADNLKKIEEKDALIQALEARMAEIDKPGILLDRANKAIQDKKYTDALDILMEITSNYTCSKEYPFAKEKLEEVNKVLRERKEQDKKELKVKIKEFSFIKNKNKIQYDDIMVNIQTVKLSKIWNFDRYDDTYMYREADKSKKFITFDMIVTTKDTNPRLPLFIVGILNNSGAIVPIDEMDIKFYSWSDYACYLGNYHDFNNDFTKREIIKFTVAAEIDSETLSSKEIYIYSPKQTCMAREENRFDNPPVRYTENECSAIDRVITISNAEKYFIVDVLNGKK